jgi:hypothetical protein
MVLVYVLGICSCLMVVMLFRAERRARESMEGPDLTSLYVERLGEEDEKRRQQTVAWQEKTPH